MKKIYLLLVLLFTGLQSVFAQFIWHPDLGTPYAGAISLPWDTRSYMFQVDNGEEFGSPGDIWDATRCAAPGSRYYVDPCKFCRKSGRRNFRSVVRFG